METLLNNHHITYLSLPIAVVISESEAPQYHEIRVFKLYDGRPGLGYGVAGQRAACFENAGAGGYEFQRYQSEGDATSGQELDLCIADGAVWLVKQPIAKEEAGVLSVSKLCT